MGKSGSHGKNKEKRACNFCDKKGCNHRKHWDALKKKWLCPFCERYFAGSEDNVEKHFRTCAGRRVEGRDLRGWVRKYADGTWEYFQHTYEMRNARYRLDRRKKIDLLENTAEKMIRDIPNFGEGKAARVIEARPFDFERMTRPSDKKKNGELGVGLYQWAGVFVVFAS